MKTDKKTLALIVDDGPGIKELLSERLARAGIEAASAGTAEEAEEAFGKICPDIILVDYSLPGRSGLQLISDLRKKAEGTGCEELPPFIVITGHGDERLAVEMMKLGAADYLVKDSEFLAKVAPAVTRALREHRTRLELRESENRYRDLVENLNDAVFTLDADGRFTYMSAAIRAMSGHYPEEVVGTAFADWIHPEDLPAVNKDFSGALEGTLRSSEFRFRKKDGTYGWGRTSSRLIMENGRVAGLRGLFSDITEQKRTMALLKDSEARFRAFFQDLPMGVAVYRPVKGNGDFEIVDFSPGAERIEGVRKEELLGRKVTECFPGVKELGLLKLFSETAADGKPRTLTSAYYRDNREKGWRENTVFRLPDGLIAAVYRDTTAEETAKLEVKEKEEKYRSLLESLPDIVMNFDREYRHSFVSANVTEIGMEPEIFLGKTHAELGFPPELCRFLEEKLRSVFGSGKPVETEFEADLPAGRKTLSWRLTPQRAPDGSVESVTTLATDITEYRSLEADYRQLFETMLDGFALHEMIYDAQGRPADYRFLRLNPAFERLTGLKAAETEGRTATEILKEEAKEWVEIYGKVALSGEPVRFEKFSAPLGRYYDILAFRPRPGQFATIFKDITAQKEAEIKLRESAVMLEVAGRMSRFGGWSVDLSAGVCHWSDEVCAIHEEPAGSTPSVEKGVSYYAPEYRDRIAKIFAACAREGVPYDEELEIITAKGNRRWIRTLGAAERDEAGKIVRVSGSFQDISDRKKMEISLRDSEETFRRLVEHSPDGIFIQLEEKLEYLNPEAVRILGAGSEDELKGTSIFDRFHPDFHETVRGRVGLLMKEKKRVPEIEEVCLRLDGSSFPALVSAVPYEREGRAGAIVTIRDITERKRMEEDLLKTQKIESLGMLAGGIAHDFNNILTGITANLSMLLAKTGRDSGEGEALAEALTAANTAKGLTRQLLAFAEGGKPVKKEIDAGRTVAEAARLALRGSPCGLKLNIQPDLWSIEADATQLSQVIINLVTNAAQAMPGGGEIAIGVVSEGGPGAPALRITVADTGTGIPEKYLKDIFDPYFTTKKQGHGLGLPMAYSIVKGHGGKISVASESGKGTTFTVSLPATGRRPGPAAAAAAPETGTGRVLVMDDEEVVLRACRRMITSLGYECALAEDGEKALKAYEEAAAAGKPFDAVIMDITIQGGMGGREAVAELRRKHPGAKVIASSGYAAGTPVSEYAAMGFDGLLAKPYNYEEMAALLKKLIGGK